MEESYPVYATQGGGKVRHLGDRYFEFIEAPEGLPYYVGDKMPEEWGIVPINEAAKQEIDPEDSFFNDWEDMMSPSRYP